MPLVSGLVSVLILPFLLLSPRGSLLAYIVTWTAALVGTVAMAVWSTENWQEEVTFANVFLRSTFPDIVILFAKVPLAYAVTRIHLSTD